MRILHTSDWHLGLHLGGHDRTEELFVQVERICQMAEENEAEVLLVAGDVFVSRAPEVTKRLADLLTPYVRRGLHVVLVRGNHDKADHFRMMRALLEIETGQSNRVHIVQTRDILQINGVQFAVVPYPTSEVLEPHKATATGTTDRHKVVSVAYADLVRAITDALEPTLPAVFVAHVNVAGVTTPSEKELTYDEGIRLGRSDLPLKPNLAYIALGHIHQCQEVEHTIPCWYSGSIDRMDMGERQDNKFVLLVDVPNRGAATVTKLPLEATPFHDLSIDSTELETLSEQYNDLDRAFVRITLNCVTGDEPVALQRRTHEVCKRCLGVQFSGEWGTAMVGSPASPEDYATTVTEYLRERFAEDPDLPELERRASQLLQEVNNAATQN
jgi:DNA repair protein SbcD/Mre11